MRNTLVATAAVALALSASVAAQAQSSVGVVGGNSVVVDQDGGIIAEQRPAFREYVVREAVPTFTVPDRVVVGATLPEAGITYYDVPQRFGGTPYRYTVVKGATVLIEPKSRRIVQVID
jgi:nucleotidyltransferase/DNA polymerase involved in DNA repair